MTSTIRLLVPLVGLVAAALIARRAVGQVRLNPVGDLLQSRWAPIAFGVVTALVTWWVWGSLSQVAVYHDEAAYQLQARIFASGRWTAPAPPLPEFWEQMAVLVTPKLAPKMPPGHAILMVPGIWLGLPGLVSVVLSGVTGGLLFALARRVSGAWVALLAWFVWLTAPRALIWRAAYFSEATTGALWLASWWALLEWRTTRRRHWLLILAACIGWGAITRPLTMLAFALPVGLVVVWTVMQHREWRDLTLALALGISILAIIPLWSSRTTGDARSTPLALYTRQYMPWDVPGFGFDSTPPLRALPHDLAKVDAIFVGLHTGHTVSALPQILWRRLSFVMSDVWSGWRSPLALLALLGLLVAPTAGWFAFATAMVLFLSYASYAHAPSWSVYYSESLPVLAFLTALGAWFVLRRIVGLPLKGTDGELVRANADIAAPLAVVIGLFLMLWPACSDVRMVHDLRQRETLYHRIFRELTAAIPAQKSIVFVRYRSNHAGHFSLVRNVPDLESARTWVVYDRGAENARLMHLAPDRVPYLYDDSRLAIVPLSDTAGPPPLAKH